MILTFGASRLYLRISYSPDKEADDPDTLLIMEDDADQMFGLATDSMVEGGTVTALDDR